MDFNPRTPYEQEPDKLAVLKKMFGYPQMPAGAPMPSYQPPPPMQATFPGITPDNTDFQQQQPQQQRPMAASPGYTSNGGDPNSSDANVDAAMAGQGPHLSLGDRIHNGFSNIGHAGHEAVAGFKNMLGG